MSVLRWSLVFCRQTHSIRRQLMMLLKMLTVALHTVNPQHTSLCSTTLTDVNNTYSLVNNNVLYFRAFTNECSGSFCNILHTIIIPPQTVFVMCLNLVLGPSAIYSLRHMLLIEKVMGSQPLS